MPIQAIILLTIVLLIAISDIMLIARKGKRASISAWAIRISYKYPSVVFIFAFGLGFVMGHLFWRMNSADIWVTIPEVLK